VSRRRDSRAARLRDLADVARRLGSGELDVLLLLAARVWAGQARYGCLDVRRDRRDFRRELLEEVADGLFYAAAALLRRQRRSRGSRRPAQRRGLPRA